MYVGETALLQGKRYHFVISLGLPNPPPVQLRRLRQPGSANPPLRRDRGSTASLIWHATTGSIPMSDRTIATSPTVGRASSNEARSRSTNVRTPARSRTSAGTTVAIRNSPMYACCEETLLPPKLMDYSRPVWPDTGGYTMARNPTPARPSVGSSKHRYLPVR